MAKEIEWGPWIDHDGLVSSLRSNIISASGWSLFDFKTYGDGLIPEGRGPSWNVTHPSFIWRLRAKSFFGRNVPVCQNSIYAPIVRYRFGRPKRSAEVADSEAIKLLRSIASNTGAPIKAPKREKAA